MQNYRFVYPLLIGHVVISNIGIKIRNLYTMQAERSRDLCTTKKINYAKSKTE